MKINYRNTCLEWLEHPQKMAFHIPENNRFKDLTPESWNFGYSVRDAFAELVKADCDPKCFRQKIRYISMPFWQAYLKAKSSLRNVFTKEALEETGTFITSVPGMTHTYFYYIKTSGEGENWEIDFTLMLFSKRPNAETAGLDLCIVFNKTGHKEFIWKQWDDEGLNFGYWAAWLVGLLTFIKYCPLETKFVAGGRKENHVGQKYVNETKEKIEILDSTWFTTIVRSEGFGVSGHFRLQPYGPGMTQRRLQWIEPFEKTGYTRKAKIL
jgi:hypothetical protein